MANPWENDPVATRTATVAPWENDPVVAPATQPWENDPVVADNGGPKTPETDSVLAKLNRLAKTPSPQFLQPFERAITSPLPGAKEAIHAGYQYGSPLGWIEDVAPDSAAGKWAHDIRTRLEEVGTGFASPANIGLAATGAATGKAIQGLIGLGFTAQQAKTTLDTYRQWQQEPDPEKKHQLSIKLGVDAGLTALLGGGTAAGHFAPEAPVARPEGEAAPTTPRGVEPAPAATTEATGAVPEQPLTQGGEVTDAQQRSNAQVQAGDTTLGVEARPEGEVPSASSGDNVVGETGGEKPVVEGQAPQEDVAVTPTEQWYHATHADIRELSPRVVKNVDTIGTWLTGSKEAARTLYGPKVYSIGSQVPQRLLEAHTDNFNEFFFSNKNLFKELFPTESISLFDQFKQRGKWKFSPEIASMREKYLAAFRGMLEDAGYEGIIWKNSRIDLRSTDPPHDVAVIFHKEPLQVVSGTGSSSQMAGTRPYGTTAHDEPTVLRTVEAAQTGERAKLLQPSKQGISHTEGLAVGDFGRRQGGTGKSVAVTQPGGGGEPATAAVSGAETPPAAETPNVTSIKNAQVDTERAVRGLPPAMEAGRKSFGSVWDEAMSEIEKNPERPVQLIDELKQKPRALSDKEDAMLLHRQIDLQNQFEKTANDLIVANEGGDLGLVDELNLKAARLSDQLLDVYEAGKQSGTETGRGLNARKMLAGEDFSLANMITQKRAAVKGRQLTPEQVAEVGKAHKDITARQIAYDAYETTPRAEAYRRRLRNLAEEYRQRTAKGDFAPRPRKQILLDPEGMKLKADLERAKIDFKRGLAKDRLQNRTWWEKALDGIAKWRRTFILSWPTVLGKLTTASGELIGITPAEELVRKGVTKVLPSKITEKSLRFGKGSSLQTEVGAIVHTWKELFKAVPQRFKTGNADIDLLYGRPDIVPPELKDFVGNLHSALKEPARQNEFFRAQQEILQRYAERGVDISDPIIQTKVGFEAYRHAMAQIFYENNRAGNAIRAFIGRLGDVNKLTGKPSMLGKAAQTAARFELPIINIPLNIIKRTFEYSFGLPTGAARVVRGMIQGLDGMPVVEADAIIKNLSRGALGASAIAYGYFHPQQFGGYYQKGEKRAPGDLKAGHARVLGHDLPPWAVHNPLLAQFQIGSTIRRIVDSKLRKRDAAGPSYRQAIVAAYSGVIEDAPLVRQTEDSLKALDIRQQNQFFGEHLKSLVPGAVEWSAKYFDKDANGNPVVRKPEDVLDYVKAAVPGLRQQVPEKTEPRRGKSPF